MHLTPKEQERLLTFAAAELARRRRRRGLRLNYVEAVALICDEILERAREGRHSVADLMSIGSRLLSREDVMDGVPALLTQLQVEVLLPDGTKLVTIHDPIRLESRAETEPLLTDAEASLVERKAERLSA
jgi:urease gamma subunit